MTKRKRRWALVLSGGGAKGLAHAGVLKALEELGFPMPDLVVGTSMGAIVGGLYACGMNGSDLADFVAERFNIRDYLDGFAYQMPDGPLSRAILTGQALGNLAVKSGIDSGRKLLDAFRDLTGGKNFDQTRVPFKCNSVDLLTGEEVVMETGSVAEAMRASSAFPAFFEPLLLNERLLVDGGIANNLPVRIAREAGFRRVLAIDVWNFNNVQPATMKTVVRVIYRAFEIAVAHMDSRAEDRASLTLRPADNASPFDFPRAKKLVALGEAVVHDNAKALESFFASDPISALKRALARKDEA